MSQLIKDQHQLFGLAVCDLTVKTYLLLIKLDDWMNEDLVVFALLNKWLNWSLFFCFVFIVFFS